MVLGVDAGSTHHKLVWLQGGEVVHQELLSTQPCMEESLKRAISRHPQPQVVIATGYGRHALVKAGIADGTITEIKAQTLGVSSLFPQVATILDLGGQDFKVIKVSDGRVLDFEMNDRCAAGTGRFIEMAANRLALSLEELDSLAGGCEEGAKLSSMCAVFAESELVSLMARGEVVERMARGVMDSIARRLVAVVKRVGGASPFLFTGGGALLGTLVRRLSDLLGHGVLVPQNPLFTASLGAAIEAEKRLARCNESPASAVVNRQTA